MSSTGCRVGHACPGCSTHHEGDVDDRGVAVCAGCAAYFVAGPGVPGDGSTCGMRIVNSAARTVVTQRQNGVRVFSVAANLGFLGLALPGGVSTLELAVAGTAGVLSAPMLFARTCFMLTPSSFEVRQGPVSVRSQIFGPQRPPRALMVHLERDIEASVWTLMARFDDGADVDAAWKSIHAFSNEDCACFTMRALHDAIEAFSAAPFAYGESYGACASSGTPVAVR